MNPDPAPPRPPPGIVHRHDNGYRIAMLDDGVDYWGLATRALAGELPRESLPERDGRQVHFIWYRDRKYVLKTDSRRVGHLDSKLRRLYYGPVYSTAMRRIWAAGRRGCDLVQTVYMVAERSERGFVRDTVQVAEYVEGPTLNEVPDPERYVDDVRRLMVRLHGYRLAFVDPNRGNFIVTDRGLRIIDLTFADSFLVGRARDYLKVKRVFGIDLPPAGWVNALLVRVVRHGVQFRMWLRRLRGGERRERR